MSDPKFPERDLQDAMNRGPIPEDHPLAKFAEASEKWRNIWMDRAYQLEEALERIVECGGMTLLGDGTYSEGANAAFNQCADIASEAIEKVAKV